MVVRNLGRARHREVLEQDLAGSFGLDQRGEGGTADLDGRPVLMDRTPRNHKAGISMKAGTAAGLIADHERKTVAARTPDLNVFDRSDHATELHAAPETARGSSPPGSGHRLVESENAGTLT